MHSQPGLELVELGALSLRDWVELTGRERQPFGAASAGLVFRPKDRHVALRDEDGRLVAAVGATIATVSVADGDPFDVVGYGGLIVRRDVRGHGLATRVRERSRLLFDVLGPDRAMLFSDEELVPLHERHGWTRVHAPVRVDQPGGRIEMPIPALWRPVRPSGWPPGIVELDGLPF